jgi:YesN/AraC family two-component response regulator
VIRVFIADDQLLIRQGLRALLDLEPEIEIAGEAGDGEEAVRLVVESNVDVLLLDVRMP